MDWPCWSWNNERKGEIEDNTKEAERMSGTPERSLTEIAPASGQKRSFGDRGSGPASKKAHIATAESTDGEHLVYISCSLSSDKIE